MNGVCSIETCSRPVHARTWCNAHYYRWRKHGDPLGGEPERTPKAIPECSIDGCARVAYGLGYCTVHYLRLKRQGDPLTVAVERRNDRAESFDARTRQEGDCLIWTGHRNGDGYGGFSVDGRSVRAHRHAWERVNGPIPDGLIVRHKCDNPPCVRIEHLELGTVQDNTDDMIARGRARWQKKETRHDDER